jgi:molybdopterin-containing oxidoreductase family iron-sulfur binding subunit
MIAPDLGGEYFLPVTCQHCKNAPCIKVCPVNATYRDKDDGTVLIDYDRCIGYRYCISACPYGVRQFNWEDPLKVHERSGYAKGYSYGYPRDFKHKGRLVYSPKRKKGTTEKCHFCTHYKAEGLDPACVRGCPGKARFVGDPDDPNSEVSRLIRDRNGFPLLPEKGTEPSCYYLPPRRKETNAYDNALRIQCNPSHL